MTETIESNPELDVEIPEGDQDAFYLARMRHSTAHLMAEAVAELFPEAKFAIGPAIKDGFYYDLDLPRALTPDDLATIEASMKRHQKAKEPFVRNEVSRDEALELFADNPYKVEIINELPADETISTYRQGDFLDLCRGPHVPDTGRTGKFKLQSVAGAYWRGDEKRPMLQRIYGTAWFTQKELDDHLARLEEAQARDHRRLGRELDLFSVSDEIGAGLILWHPNGAMVRYLVEQFEQQEQLKRGYQLVYTPHIASEKIYQTSGHLQTYKENMYAPITIDEVNYYLKPMNCPGHIMIYKNQVHSYRDLPIRLAELGTVYRYERSGTLHGMLRVRGFTQDDSHIFCTEEQVGDEVEGVIRLAEYMADIFGYQFKAYLATRPEKWIGDEDNWDRATATLQAALDRRNLPWKIDEGGGAFYGPKIDIKWVDALGREWTGPTIQVDFNLPERFDVNYIGEDGDRHRVAMIHRTLLGSMERFVGGLVEHYAGAFPAWLAPTQAVVVPITDDQVPFAREVERQLKDAGMRVDLDESSNRMQAKIRTAQLRKIPYMLVIGKREAEAGAVAVRLRSGEDLGATPVADFLAMATAVIDSRSLSLTEPRVAIDLDGRTPIVTESPAIGSTL
ncbi:MAG: Threonyl-tRNA synthetase [uncultured Thermomicrobiales bacterium]|uniref:Threonine--tRNA ligase n=1 Tax=uncultured Thermomicrobiales bacterium TaxID=1645740 RepID=A0A6J4UIM1_9BACT|nr:MAG: Threonyl-tRNA synthetase [uncultured Thermomicrobiales bacterium]